jgi:prevent-host-death family protein
MTRRRRIGVRQLKNEAPRVLSEVREEGAEYLVTRHGKPVALISPLSPDDLDPDRKDQVAGSLAKLQRTAKSVSEAAAGITAPAVVSRQRR